MSYGIRIVEAVGAVQVTEGSPRVGHWVKEYDPDAHGGQGFVDVTEDEGEALEFSTAAAAWDCWKQQSTIRPYREDGKPNRPLTAITVMVEELLS